jgi:hypothetical protein
MADSHQSAQGAHLAHPAHTAHHGSDTGAAFLGLIIGAIVIFAFVVTVVKLTNAHYANEKPAAEASQH